MVSSRERCSTSHCKNERTSYSKSGRWKRVMLARQLHRWEQQLFLENLQRKRQPQTEGDDPPDCTEARSGRWERVVLTRQLPLAVIPRVSAMEEAISNWGRWPNRRLHRGKLWSPRESDARPTIAQMKASVSSRVKPICNQCGCDYASAWQIRKNNSKQLLLCEACDFLNLKLLQRSKLATQLKELVSTIVTHWREALLLFGVWKVLFPKLKPC